MAARKIRPIRIEGNLAYVPLTKGYEAVIDAADVPLVAGWNWYAHVTPWTVYAARGNHSGGMPRTVYMHGAIVGAVEGFTPDHRDTDGLNNRRYNLRLATRAQQQRNQKKPRNNTSGLKGVTWHKQRGKWMSQIEASGKRYYLGVFETKEAAHAAYCIASATIHGGFGRTE